MSDYAIEPVPDENYEGRQWGYVVTRDGRPYLHVTTGGTGDCWNFENAEDREDPDVIPHHVCELDDLIGALTALRDSDAHAAHVARWAAPAR